MTTVATEHALLADQRVKAADLYKLKDPNGHGRYTSTALHRKYPFITKAAFDTIKSNLT